MLVAHESALGLGNPDLGQQLNGSPACGSRIGPVNTHRFFDLFPDRDDRIQGRLWVLENHRHFTTPDLTHLGFGQRHEVATTEFNRSRLNAAGQPDHPQDGARGDRFPGAGLSNDSDNASRVNLEGHSVDRPNGFSRGDEGGDQVGHSKNGSHCRHARFTVLFNASEIRLKESASRKSTRVGPTM